jgi:hypothetical protein
MPEVQDIKHTGPVLKHKQSKTNILPRLSSRICVAGPSGVGKGVLVMQLLTNPEFYRGCFERIYYFSQSAKVDSNLLGLKAYCEKELGQTEECLFSEFDEGFLRDLLNRQLKITQHLKQRAANGGPKKAMGVAVVIDDFIDMPSVVRKANGVLSSIAIRGRHANVTCFYMTQKYRALGTELRTNFNALMFFRQRSRFDLEAFLEENSAIIPREQLYQMYVKATSRDHGFLFCDLMQSDPNKMFYASFNARLVPNQLTNSSGSADGIE